MSIRFTIIYVSLGVVLVTLVALVAGPAWGLRLDYEKGQRLQLVQVIAPTFVTYLSTAIAYASFGASFPEPRGERGRILRLVTAGSLVTFVLVVMAATAVYYQSANGALLYGRLGFDEFSSIIAVMIGFLGVTTTVISTAVFAVKQ